MSITADVKHNMREIHLHTYIPSDTNNNVFNQREKSLILHKYLQRHCGVRESIHKNL